MITSKILEAKDLVEKYGGEPTKCILSKETHEILKDEISAMQNVNSQDLSDCIYCGLLIEVDNSVECGQVVIV